MGSTRGLFSVQHWVFVVVWIESSASHSSVSVLPSVVVLLCTLARLPSSSLSVEAPGHCKASKRCNVFLAICLLLASIGKTHSKEQPRPKRESGLGTSPASFGPTYGESTEAPYVGPKLLDSGRRSGHVRS